MESKSLNYKVYYTVLNANDIYNECGPLSAGPVGWTPDLIAKREKAAQRYIDRLNEKNSFYERLEESILEEGIRNPILIAAGWIPDSKLKRLPPNLQARKEDILVCHNLGGSRLWVAQRHSLKVPCIVSDFVGRFADNEELTTEEQISEKFLDKPRRIVFTKYGIAVSSPPQIHLG